MVGRYLVALSLLLLTALAVAAPPVRHIEWCRAAIGRLPVFGEDRASDGKAGELERIADAIAGVSVDAPRSPREWASVHFAIGNSESGFSSRIIAGNCKAHECDHGRARGYGQTHRNSLNGADFDQAPGNIEAQVRLTDAALRRAYWTCSRSGVPWLIGTINAYAGRRCGDTWPGLEQRVATFNRLTSVSTKKGAS